MTDDLPESGRLPEPPSEADIAERLRQVRAELNQMALPDLPDDEVDAKRERLVENVDRVGFQAPEPPDLQIPRRTSRIQREKRESQDAKAYRGLAVGLQLAYMMIGVPAIGIGIGWLFDLRTGATTGRGIGGTLGFALALYLVIKLGAHFDKES